VGRSGSCFRQTERGHGRVPAQQAAGGKSALKSSFHSSLNYFPPPDAARQKIALRSDGVERGGRSGKGRSRKKRELRDERKKSTSVNVGGRKNILGLPPGQIEPGKEHP